MLAHLLDPDFPNPIVDDEPGVVCSPAYADEFIPLKGADPGTVLRATLASGQILQPAAPDSDPVIDAAVARAGVAGFLTGAPQGAMTAGNELLTEPGIVAHARALLTAFDMDFLADAARIRNLLVTTLIEETQGPKASTRLKAVELLGKVTEIGLFTERVAHSVDSLPEAELDRKITEKLARMTGVTTVRPVRKPVETAEDIESVVEEVFSAVKARKTKQRPSKEGGNG